MFGYVRPSLARLSQEDKDRFSAMYCGLCRALSRRCGRAASLILNYDFTFLAVLLAEGAPEDILHGRCVAHPGQAGTISRGTVLWTWQRITA